MEVVTVGTVRVDDAIELLREPANLKTLARSHGTVCFALVDEMAVPGFYGRLIESLDFVKKKRNENHLQSMESPR